MVWFILLVLLMGFMDDIESFKVVICDYFKVSVGIIEGGDGWFIVVW